MYIVRAQFEVLSQVADTAAFPDILNRSMRPTDHVEHSHVALDEGNVNVTFFILQPTLPEAQEVAMDICVRCISNADHPSLWRLVRCAADVIGPESGPACNGSAPQR